MVGRRSTGNERVVTNLARAMHDASDHELFMYFTDRASAESWGEAGMSRLTPRLLRCSNPVVRRAFTIAAACRNDQIDVLLAHYSRPVLLPCPVVTLVHDVSFARYPEYFSRSERLYLTRTVPWSIRRSDSVITGSAFSRDEMVALYGVDPERVRVAPYGVDPVFTNGSPERPTIGAPYFLAIGNLEPRKNMICLLRAFRWMIKAHPEVCEQLVIVGQERLLADAIYREADDLRRSGRMIFTGYVDDARLTKLLGAATAFAYPSFYEGFGLPPLEAMASGCPVVVSEIPVMAEVVGTAGLRLPPDDERQWADALWSLATDPALRARLTAAGLERAGPYTWERTGHQVLQALELATR
jgi:glycosyltransferase involved in cell wall biosynthesis